LDRDDASRVMHEQGPGQPARPGADLDHRRTRQIPGRARDLAGEIKVEEEVLTKRLAREQSMPRDDVAQRRQAVHAHAAGWSSTWSASRRASFSAATRLSGRAMPLPAMSNAVPWSGEVRMKGR